MSYTLPHILFLSHDANRAGAQLFLLNIMKEYKRKGYQIGICFFNPWGPLLQDFREIADEYDAVEAKSLFQKIGGKLGINYTKHQKLKDAKFDIIYANTIASASLALSIKSELKIPLLTHIHELSYSIEMYSSAIDRKSLFEKSDIIVACSNAVFNNLVETYQIPLEKLKTVHSFIDNDSVKTKIKESFKELTLAKYQLPTNQFLVGACGNSEYRKGLDIFAKLIKEFQLHKTASETHFLWIGAQPEGEYYQEVVKYIKENNIKRKLTLIPPTPDAVALINILDVFVVSSREDPFPLVMLEAALCQKPILGFENTGGCGEFVGDKAGMLSPLHNVKNMSEHLNKLLEDKELRQHYGEYGQMQVNEIYNFKSSFDKLESIISDFSIA